MYICVCKAITGKQIDQVIDEGATSCRQVNQSTGAGSVCGKCCTHIKELLTENRQNQPAMLATGT